MRLRRICLSVSLLKTARLGEQVVEVALVVVVLADDDAIRLAIPAGIWRKVFLAVARLRSRSGTRAACFWRKSDVIERPQNRMTDRPNFRSFRPFFQESPASSEPQSRLLERLERKQRAAGIEPA